MPEIELLDFDMIWESTGPVIITFIVLMVFAIISLILFGNMRKGSLKDIAGIGIVVGLAVVTYASFQITAYIWSL
ncbi:hypothetical protein [Metabacillus halosaccharovorans]|uniref:DUF2759 domain-containing protein n=1 Tax=Metabacillus halosaccharovorans TaxID=930124 RepID=A0ABT3DDE6_9BACI|nr:hypothetical protein [Metabacillus halosaccharovorans]MCV9884712.1 hypothetical protein [Metabacillus halosaccharovorans]